MKSIFAVVFTLFSFLLLASAAPNGRPGGYDLCEQCNPSPPLNKCDITTSCIVTEPSKQLHCACRAGYMSDYPDKQYRLHFGGQEYRVFVRPGVVCNTLCPDWTQGAFSCQNVPIHDECNP